MSPRVLIVVGNPAKASEKLIRLGGPRYGDGYGAALRHFLPGLETFVLEIADGERLPQGVAIGDFDGVAWTGSALSAYDDVSEVRCQIEFAREVAAAGVPSFGSCWGLQIAAAAAGGSVRRNPKGLEIGVARRIRLTEEGRAHRMFADKAPVFDAVAIHGDEVERMPEGGRILATNDMSEVQAAEIGEGPASFWGVQYHPEFDLDLISRLLLRDEQKMVRGGLARSVEDVRALAGDYQALSADPTRTDLAWRFGLDRFVLDPTARMAELGAWLDTKVTPRMAGR